MACIFPWDMFFQAVSGGRLDFFVPEEMRYII
jgi:hypothetical protein